MNKVQLKSVMASSAVIQKVPAEVRSLAAFLMATLQIRPGIELVHLIGRGDEYSNQRAIESWLMGFGMQLQDMSPDQATKKLYRRLHDQLTDQEVFQ
jgi:hypothetical protein